MVINKNSMGYEMNKKERKKLICLYEEYIKDGDNKGRYFTNNAISLDREYPVFYSEIVNKAMNLSWGMQGNTSYSKKLSIKEAKKILKELKKEDEEDK